jgi:hypothetical protein
LPALFAGEFKRSLGRMWGAMYVFRCTEGESPALLSWLLTMNILLLWCWCTGHSFSLSQGLVQNVGCSSASHGGSHLLQPSLQLPATRAIGAEPHPCCSRGDSWTCVCACALGCALRMAVTELDNDVLHPDAPELRARFH